MKTVLIIAALCLMLVLMSSITSPARKPVFQIGALVMADAGQSPAVAARSGKRSAGGQPRWLRVVPGLFR